MRCFFSFLFLLLITSDSYSQDYSDILYNDCTPELVKTFKNSTEPGGVKFFIETANANSSCAMAFDEFGNFYVVEASVERIEIFNDSLIFQSEIIGLKKKFATIAVLLEVKEGVITGRSEWSYGEYDTNRNTFLYVYYYPMIGPGGKLNPGSTKKIGKILLSYLENGKIVSVLQPSNDAKRNQMNFLNSEKTKALFANANPEIPKGFSLDKKDRLFFNGELITGDFNTFYEYWMDYYTKNGVEYYKHAEHKINFSIGAYNNLLGRDASGHWYWSKDYNIVMIFDKFGICQESLRVPENTSMIIPALHPSGDIYFMSYDKEQVYLWRVKKCW